jgi:hypothetical protein
MRKAENHKPKSNYTAKRQFNLIIASRLNDELLIICNPNFNDHIGIRAVVLVCF